jgi:hypothetical protein
MKLYTDANLANQVTSLDFGIVAAGETKEFVYYVSNDTKALLENIVFETIHKEIKIVSSPAVLKSGEVGKLVLAWAPSITLKEGLRTVLKVKATELWS